MAVGAGVAVLGSGIIAVAHRNILPTEKVDEVTDGDSFFIANRQPIRLRALDAPEPGNCYSLEAKAELKKLILGKQVLLKEPQVDHFGRILAIVYLGDQMINELLIKNGFVLYTSYVGVEQKHLEAASRYARAHRLGIFSEKCYQVTPPDPKCNIKGNFDDNNNRKTYFLPECSYYDVTIVEKFRGEQWFCSEKEAKTAGFTKAHYCP